MRKLREGRLLVPQVRTNATIATDLGTGLLSAEGLLLEPPGTIDRGLLTPLIEGKETTIEGIETTIEGTGNLIEGIESLPEMSEGRGTSIDLQETQSETTIEETGATIEGKERGIKIEIDIESLIEGSMRRRSQGRSPETDLPSDSHPPNNKKQESNNQIHPLNSAQALERNNKHIY